MKDKLGLKLYELEYRKCSLCNTSYMTMLQVKLKYFGENKSILLCKSCVDDLDIKTNELKERLANWT